MRSLFVLFLSCLCYNALAQGQVFIDDHQHYVKLLANAKDSLYTSILSAYDKEVGRRPTNVKLQIERCKFMQNALYDSYEEYNPNYEQADACSAELLEKFPDEPEVFVYRTEYLYGDSLMAMLERLEDRLREPNWRPFSWKIYHLLASNSEQPLEIIRYGKLARDYNDTLDVSLMLGRAYKEVDNRQAAIKWLGSNLDSSSASWELNQKGQLLLELGEAQRAVDAFRLARKDTAGWQDKEGLAQALIDSGFPDEARGYLKKAADESTWQPLGPLQKLLNFDLDYSSADTAKVTYDRFVESGFLNDAFGIYRLRLFFKDPFLPVSFSDVGRLLLLVFMLAVVFAVPYLWILPIYNIGNYFKQNGSVFSGDQLPFTWTLRHFWWVCSLWLALDILSTLIFSYGNFLSYFVDGVAETSATISKQQANWIIFFSIGAAYVASIFVPWKDVWSTRHSLIANLKTPLWQGFSLALLLRFFLGVYWLIINRFDVAEPGAGFLSVTDQIISINKFYHPALAFFFVVLLVPLYEELLFRGVALTSCAKYMKFGLANALQAGTFAILHEEWKLLPFYFAFGMLAGYYVGKSRSLATGIVMHITNNLIAFLTILATR